MKTLSPCNSLHQTIPRILGPQCSSKTTCISYNLPRKSFARNRNVRGPFQQYISTRSSHSDSSSPRPQTFTTYHPPRLHDKVAIVTGSSSGLGRAIARAFASHGTRLVVCADLHAEPRAEGVEPDAALPTDQLVNQIYGQGRAVFIKTDVTSTTDVMAMVQKAIQDGGGRVDILVNNAGLGNVSGSPLIHELQEKDWDRVMNVNLRAIYLTTKYALAQMINQPLTPMSSAYAMGDDDALHRRGHILNVASMLASIALPHGTSAYCASKAGVLNLTRQLALDYAKYKINVNALCPGFLRTAMTAGNWGVKEREEEMRTATPWGSWGRVEDAARMAVSLCTEDAAWVTGEGVAVDGGYSAQ